MKFYAAYVVADAVTNRWSHFAHIVVEARTAGEAVSAFYKTALWERVIALSVIEVPPSFEP